MIKEKEIGGRKYLLVPRSWSTSRAWGHDCDLYENGDRVHSARCRYYNRTWERYEYQSVMQVCLDEYIESERNWQERRYREIKGVSRMTAKKRAEFEKWLAEQSIWPILKGLQDWYEEL